MFSFCTGRHISWGMHGTSCLKQKQERLCNDSGFLGFMALTWERAYDAVTEDGDL